MKKILLVMLGLLSDKNYTMTEKQLDHLTTENTFTITDASSFDFGIQLSYGPLYLDGNILFLPDTISIGNNQNQSNIFFPSLPIGSSAITLPLKYLMIAEGSNVLYIGNSSSPIPSPDFIIIENLIINSIMPNTNTDTLTFNQLDNDTTLGNENINMILYADTVNLYNLDDTKIKNLNNKEEVVGTMNFFCPVNFNNNITIKTINIAGNFNFKNDTNPVILAADTIQYSDLIITNAMTIGNDSLNSSILFKGALNANSDTIALGSPDNLITQIINIPILEGQNIDNFFYFLSDTEANLIYIGPQSSEISETIDILNVDTLSTNFINTNNSANTTFETKELSLLGNVTVNANINFLNSTFMSEVIFNNASIDPALFLYFIGQNNIAIKNTIPLTINQSYFNTVYFYSDTNRWTDPRNSSDFNVYLCIDPTDGKVYRYELTEKKKQSKNQLYKKQIIQDIKMIKNDLQSLENKEHTIQNKISEIEHKNINLKKQIKLLKKILNNSTIAD